MSVKNTNNIKAKAAPAASKTTSAPKAAKAPVEKKEKIEVAAQTEVATKKINFELPKEAVTEAITVALLGDFNSWNLEKSVELKKQKDGSYKVAVELEAGKEYQYRFLINGTRWENAWKAPKYVSTPFGTENSVVVA